MSVTVASVRPHNYPLATVDRRFPNARWQMKTASVGDASAGVLTQSFLLKSGSTYSLEQIYCRSTLTTTPNGQVLVQTGEDAGDGGELQFDFAIEVTPGPTLAVMRSVTGTLPTFLFRPSTAFSADSAIIAVTFANPGAANTITIAAWGYRWENEAWKLPGGPVRPAYMQEGFLEALEAGEGSPEPRVGVIAPPYGTRLK